jgi:2-dehydropantoate 2-reductase
MRYIVHGAGAIGSLVGGMLAEGGAEVVLVARPEHAAAINGRGLSIRSRGGERQVKNLSAVTTPAEISPRSDDVILLTVKTAQTSASVQELREIFPEVTPIVCLQNAVRNEEFAARRFLHVYGGLAGLSSTLIEPGVIAQTLDLRVGLGNYPRGAGALAQEMAADFTRGGFKATTHQSVMAVKWSKLILNLNNATQAIIDCWVQLARVLPAVSSFMAEVQEEGYHVLEVAGISLDDPNNPYNVPATIAGFRAVVDDPAKIAEVRAQPPDLRTYPSTWVDLKAKRGETEAGYFNGEIILLGEKYGVPTPFNSTLLQVVEEMAAEKIEPGRHRIEELADLVEQRRLKIYHQQIELH